MPIDELRYALKNKLRLSTVYAGPDESLIANDIRQLIAEEKALSFDEGVKAAGFHKAEPPEESKPYPGCDCDKCNAIRKAIDEQTRPNSITPPKPTEIYCEGCEKGYIYFEDAPHLHHIPYVKDVYPGGSMVCQRRKKPNMSQVLRAGSKGYLRPYTGGDSTSSFSIASYEQAKSISAAISAIADIYEAYEKSFDAK